MSTPACIRCIAVLWRSTCGETGFAARLGHGSACHGAGEQIVDTVPRQRRAAGAGEDDTISEAAEFAQSGASDARCLGPQRHDPFLASLAVQFEAGASRIEPDLLAFERRDLRDAGAAVVEHQ